MKRAPFLLATAGLTATVAAALLAAPNPPPAPQFCREGTSRSIGLPQGGEELSAPPRSGTRPTAKVAPELGVGGPSSAPPPTFTKNVAPILYANCTDCHRAGQIAPFALQTYADAKTYARQIAAVTQSRYMPPWKAEKGWGAFHGERRLTAAQIATLQAWADTGAPEGRLADLPPAPQFPVDGWRLGTPDLVVKMPQAFTVPADGPDLQQCFVVPLPVPAQRFVTAYEFRPSNPKVVHHAILYTDGSGVARQKQAASGQVGFPSFGGPGFLPTSVLGAWVPGTTPLPLPAGIGKRLPGNNDLVIQTHFHPTGKPETEQSEVGIYFAKQPPAKQVTGILQADFALNIPPGTADYTATDTFVVPADVDVLSIQPHAHLLCKDMKVSATLPDGTVKRLIWIADWDWNWQGAYQYQKPVRLPRGTFVHMTYTYDNSADNVHNPNTPPRAVHFGEQTKDEMALCGLEVVAVHESDRQVVQNASIWHVISQGMAARHKRPA